MSGETAWWPTTILLVLAFALGCLVGWTARRDQAAKDACASICAPKTGITEHARCYCAFEAKP